MSSTFKALVFVVCGWCLGTTAQADPILLYTFKTTSILCDPLSQRPICTSQGLALEQQSLDDMYIGLSPSALSNGSATLKIQNEGPGSSVPTVNIGVEQMSIYLYLYGPNTIVLPDGAEMPLPGGRLVKTLSVAVGQYLTGAIKVNNTASDITMSTLPGETEWHGRYNSDALNQNISFTGNWLFSRVVPEPGTLALLMVALAVAVSVSRRRTSQ